MTVTYDVRVWQAEVYRGGQPTTDHVRWTVDGKQFKKFKQFKEAYRNKARAEICRADPVSAACADPVSAACKGRAFSAVTGLSVSPATGLSVSPATGLSVSPATGLSVSPATGVPVSPARTEGSMSRYEFAYDARIWEAP